MKKNIGKYLVQWELGEGVYSKVFLGEDNFSGRKAVIKVCQLNMFQDVASTEQFKTNFINEAGLVSKLEHPHIAAILDAGIEEGVHYIVAEYVSGKTLQAYCKPEKLLPFDDVVEMVFKACSALEYAANKGVIHRDIRPSNMLLPQGTDVKISDFGTTLMKNATLKQILTAGALPDHMPPEQIQEKELTLRSDIYSLGVVMFQLLCGQLPYKADSNVELIEKINRAPIPSILEIRPDIPPNMVRIVERCLQKNPDDRYQTWGEMIQDLSTIDAELEIPSESITDTKKFNLLRRLAFFKGFSDEALWEVLKIAKWGKYPAEKTLLKEGKPGSSMYIVASGKARILKNGVVLGIIGEGDCFGEMSYIRGEETRRSASVVSDTDIIIIRLNADAIQKVPEQVEGLLKTVLLKIMADRLEKTSIMASMI